MKQLMIVFALIVFSNLSIAQTTEFGEPTLLILNTSTKADLNSLFSLIKKGGGRVTHRYPPYVFIGNIPIATRQELIRLPIVRDIRTDLIDAKKYTKLDRTSIGAIEAWNNNFHGMSTQKGLDKPPSKKATPLSGDAIEIEDRTPDKSPSNSVTAPRSGGPYGAGLEDTSEYLLGAISVAVILVESDGSIDTETEDWSSSREVEVVSEIQNGLSWLSNNDPDADLSFTYHFYYGRTNSDAQTGYEPINRPSTDQTLWMNEIMTKFGYGQYRVTGCLGRFTNSI